MRRIIAAVRRALHEPALTLDVHFHNGPHGAPAPCYDARCASPRL
jgi:hypothetical protein